MTLIILTALAAVVLALGALGARALRVMAEVIREVDRRSQGEPPATKEG